MDKEEQYQSVLDRIATINKTKDRGYINHIQLETLTGEPLTDDYVEKSNENLTNSYKYIVSSYGFDNFEDLYDYAKDNTLEEISKSEKRTVGRGGKDFHSLSKQKRKVIRNGKPMDTHIYEDVSMGTDNRIKTPTGEEGEPQIANELLPVFFDEDSGTLSEESNSFLNKQKKELEQVFDYNKEVNYARLLVDPIDGTIKAVEGFALEKGILTYGYLYADGITSNLDSRYLMDLIRIGLIQGLDIAVPDTPNSMLLTELKEYYGFQNYDDEVYIITKEDLRDAFGYDKEDLKEN